MGNTNSSNENNKEVAHKNPDSNSKDATTSKSSSQPELNEKYCTRLMPIEKLTEILKKSNPGENGISADVFVSYVFPQYIDLGHRLFRLMQRHAKNAKSYLSPQVFRQQCEWFLGIMDDAKIMECYIKMYSQDDNPEVIDKDGVKKLLFTCYTIATQHSSSAALCLEIDRTLTSVSKSIFFNQDSLSIGFVCRWFEQNLPRLILLLHKYCVHILSTAYRGLDQTCQSNEIELQTPVLEPKNVFPDTCNDNAATLLSLSQVWLLAGALPALYSKPQNVTAQSNNKSAEKIFKSKLSIIPSHWTLLYNSSQHGIGANRFLHHVLGYRGPTLILIHTKDEQTYCIASPNEWKETHLFTGSEGSCILQIFPKFAILENKPNILYLNMSIRGYPKGLRAGTDPRNPVISVDEYFENVNCKGIPTALLLTEVWGCGDKSSREVQLDIKKWQIKESERQRTVKLTAADWMDHPDRYLLELGGRENYNN